ncbi:MAG: hypothetical protein HRT66_00640, partial [Flavobacteriaceae bacterium]|nr:hypothetical protein [Flavobacteriaceae bacterium]
TRVALTKTVITKKLVIIEAIRAALTKTVITEKLVITEVVSQAVVILDLILKGKNNILG